MEKEAIRLFRAYCPKGQDETIINLDGQRFKMQRTGRKVTAEAVK
jgi:hypothetical protein